MLQYKGCLYFDKSLDSQELEFLSAWQSKLEELYKEYFSTSKKTEREEISLKLNTYCGINFDSYQRWAIFFAMSPMISFEHDKIVLEGKNKKGNLREALLAYKHFFLNDNAVLKECLELDYLKPHNFSGIIEGQKTVDGVATNWCYLFENNQVYSIDAPNIEQYNLNPNKWDKIFKEDTFQDKLNKYFPPLINYANTRKSIYEKINTSVDAKKTKKIKI